MGEKAENPDKPKLTTTEWKEINGNKLPEVKGISSYKPLKDNTVRFAINVWAGWAPIILANDGFKAGKVWKTPDGEEFKVDLVLIDDPVAMRDAYAAGDVHIGWATLDMVPLFMDGVRRQDGQAEGQPRHAPHLPADRLVQRRRRHRGPRKHQDRRRPARQEARAGAELARRSTSR